MKECKITKATLHCPLASCITGTSQLKAEKRVSMKSIQTEFADQHEHADDKVISVSICALGRSSATSLFLQQHGSSSTVRRNMYETFSRCCCDINNQAHPLLCPAGLRKSTLHFELGFYAVSLCILGVISLILG